MTLRLVEPVLSDADTERTMTNGEMANAVMDAAYEVWIDEESPLPGGMARQIVPRLFWAVSKEIRDNGSRWISLAIADLAEYSRVLADAYRTVPWTTEESVRTKWEEIERSMPIVVTRGNREVRFSTELEPKLEGLPQRIRVWAELWYEVNGKKAEEVPVLSSGYPFRARDLEHLFDNIHEDAFFADRAVLYSGIAAVRAALQSDPIQVLIGIRYNFGQTDDTMILDWGDGTGQYALAKRRLIYHTFAKPGVYQPRVHRKGTGWVDLPIRIEAVMSMGDKAKELRGMLARGRKKKKATD